MKDSACVSEQMEITESFKEEIKTAEESEIPKGAHNLDAKRQVGPLTFTERAEKIYKFFLKKKQKHNSRKYTYKCR